MQAGYIDAFQPQEFSIDASAGANGTITPSGHVAVDEGSDQSFTIVPDANFSVLDVTVDGVSKGPLPSYTFQDVVANHTIAASFIGGGGIVHTITATELDQTAQLYPTEPFRFLTDRISHFRSILTQVTKSMMSLSTIRQPVRQVPTHSAM